jgi:hypothetical protein
MTRSLWWDVIVVENELCLSAEITSSSGEFGVLAVLEGDDCKNLAGIGEVSYGGSEVGWKAVKGKSYFVAYGMYEYMVGSDFNFRIRVRVAHVFASPIQYLEAWTHLSFYRNRKVVTQMMYATTQQL